MAEPAQAVPTIDDIRAAARRIAPYIHRTPVLTCRGIDELAGGNLVFKCENFQKVGAFKMRGASNVVAQLDPAVRQRGVATHSSGNHGAALALAARNFGIKSFVVMPENASEVKKRAVAAYGAEITYCGPSLESRDRVLSGVVARTGATVIHPYNDYRIIAGQGTAALELLEDFDDLDVVMAPVGGGGLISGTAIAAKALLPRTQVIGVEPEEVDDALQSLRSGLIMPATDRRSIADGLLASLGNRTFSVIRGYVDDIVTVSESAIIQAMRLIWERMKIVVEPSAAVPLAALLTGKFDLRGRRAGVILSGGNVDLDALPWTR
ncbi:MAG: pyridoxal-phosphate dependent enzyme [Gammaproteobacteria bacterium]|nr:pyridoxal-phosphate dependent enzyme [Gammaproteobacteria bacterium]